MMHPKELPANHAILVKPIGITPIKEGDIVIIGIKCKVGDNGEFIPFNNKVKTFVSMLGAELSDNVYLFKHITEQK